MTKLRNLCDVRGGVHSTITYGNDVTELDDWQRDAHPWTVELRYKGRKFTTPFWTGPAWDHEPTTADVLENVLSSVEATEQGFEEWAESLGYDTDSRKIEQLYRDVRAEGEKVRRLLGDELDTYLYADR